MLAAQGSHADSMVVASAPCPLRSKAVLCWRPSHADTMVVARAPPQPHTVNVKLKAVMLMPWSCPPQPHVVNVKLFEAPSVAWSQVPP
jgi:hypothetical protein